MATIKYMDWDKTTRDQRWDASEGKQLPMSCYTTICQIGQGDPAFQEVPSDEEILEKLFAQFNIGDHGGLRVRSMSVGDIVVLEGSNKVGNGSSRRVYLCLPCGWKRTLEAA